MSRSRHIPEAVRRRVAFFDEQTCAECGRTIDGDELLRHLDHREASSDGVQRRRVIGGRCHK